MAYAEMTLLDMGQDIHHAMTRRYKGVWALVDRARIGGEVSYRTWVLRYDGHLTDEQAERALAYARAFETYSANAIEDRVRNNYNTGWDRGYTAGRDRAVSRFSRLVESMTQ